jgi:hypothetical protein
MKWRNQDENNLEIEENIISKLINFSLIKKSPGYLWEYITFCAFIGLY